MGIRRVNLDDLVEKERSLRQQIPSPAPAQSNLTNAQLMWLKAVSRESGLPWLAEVEVENIDPELIRPLSLMIAREQMALPMWERNGKLEVAIAWILPPV